MKAKNEKVTIPSGSFHTHMNVLKGTGDNLRVLAVGVGIWCKILCCLK